MKKIIFLGAFIVAILSACSRPAEVIQIADVTQPTILNLNSTSKNVSGISLRLRGQIDGSAVLSASNWETQRLSGKVDYQGYHDRFHAECDLQYQPMKVTSGALTVEYKFH
jgi:hypothetical protein